MQCFIEAFKALALASGLCVGLFGMNRHPRFRPDASMAHVPVLVMIFDWLVSMLLALASAARLVLPPILGRRWSPDVADREERAGRALGDTSRTVQASAYRAGGFCRERTRSRRRMASLTAASLGRWACTAL